MTSRRLGANWVRAVVSVAVFAALNLLAETMPPLPKGAFTYAVIPDTQSYDGEGRHTKRGRTPGVGPTTNEKFDAIVDWLVANAEKENILFVSHTGDIVDVNNDFQWRFASNAMSRLDGKLPYAVVPGNHDMTGAGDTTLFQKYFPASRYAGSSWYAATFPGFTNSAGLFVSGNNANTICLFGQGDEKFAVVSLECNAPDKVLEWAARELEKYADRHVIVATHQDLGAIKKKDGRRILNDTKGLSKEALAKYTPDLSMLGRMEWHKCHGKDGNSGLDIWKKFTSRQKSAFLVVSGDQGMIKITRVDEKGVHGNMVYSLMQDTGGGFIRIFRFVPAKKVVRCYTIDPRKGGELVHSYGVWRDSKWFNFELPYPEKAAAPAIPADDPIAARRLEWNGMHNVRDLGGLSGLGGRCVRKGRIYRSDGLNKNAHYRDSKTKKTLPKSEWKGPGANRITPEAAKHVVEELGVRTDLDLRTDGETFGMTGSPLGDKVRWVHISSSSYAGMGSKSGREAFTEDFKVFLDEANYPIVFHCIAGADRTGSLACILNGLLGVDEDLLHRDWQYTWTGRAKPAPEERWKRLMEVFSKFEGATLNEKIEKYVISCGFTHDDIARFRALMLETEECRVRVPAPGIVPEAHRPPVVAGARYRTILAAQPYSDPSQNPTGALFNAELAALPVFRDCALVNHSSLRRAPDGKAAFRRLEENYAGGVDDPRWRSFKGNPKPDLPLFSYMVTKRDAGALVGPIDLDQEQYERWKFAHTNFFSFRMLCEWGVDLTHLSARASRISDPERRAEFMRTWCAPVLDRYAQIELARRYVERLKALHYGDADAFTAMRSFFALDHVAAAWGAKALLVETTNTTGPKKEYRWAVQGMFARGASRQFQIPWGWYVAVYFNGLRKDGSWMDNSTPSYTVRSSTKFPEAGLSASLFNRVCHYAYLNGAGAVEVESWLSHLLMPDEAGRLSLSPRGRLFSSFHDFTRRHSDRGIPYAPVAVLVPFAQGYPATGGKSWASFEYLPGDYAVDSVFFTLQPGFERPAALARGAEANFHNSPYPVMCDVLSPDSPQDPEAFFSALMNYPVAILAGEYRDKSFEPLLKRYEEAGGRLLRVGPDMLPPFEGDLPAELWSGRRRFPALDSFFAEVRDEFFPVKVSGDVLWGLNKTEKGWWVWCLNNKGVTKFADVFEEIDESAAAPVRVDLGATVASRVREILSERDVAVREGGFDWTVPAGGVSVFEITR